MDEFKNIMPIFELVEFFRIPDGKKEYSTFHDKEGRPRDCNIYHPKYGEKYKESDNIKLRYIYRGFVTKDKEPIITLWNPTVYTDYDNSSQLVYCLYDWAVYCLHDDGRVTNKDGIELFDAKFEIHQSKYVEDEKGFEQVFLREFKKSNIPCKDYFKEWLVKHVEDKVKPVHDKFHSSHGRDLWVAHEFVKWLKRLTPETMPRNKDELFSVELIKRINEINETEKIFEPLTNESLLNILSNPEEHGDKLKHKKIGKYYGLLYQLELIAGGEWIDNFVSITGINAVNFRKMRTQEKNEIKLNV